MKCLGNFVCGTDAADSVLEPDIKQTNQDTMKGLANRFRNALSILLFAGAMSLNSCQEPEVLQPELMINDTEVTVPGTGGIAEVGYTLTNPADGAEWSAEKDQDWISAFDFSEDGVIKISVDPNYVEEPREAMVTVYYSEIEQGFTVKVIQEAGTPLQPVITLDQEEVEVSGKGGEVIVKYEVENPVAGAELSVEYDCDWITGLDTSVDGEICFDVALHYVAEPRETVLTLKYDEITMSLPVKQLEGDPQDVFSINLDEVNMVDAVATITPADNEMTYMTLVSEAWWFDEKGNVDAVLDQVLNDYSMIAGMAGMSFEDFLKSEVLMQGVQTVGYGSLVYDTEYELMVVGLDLDCTRTSEAVYAAFTTKDVEKVDISFDVDIKVNGPDANITVVPSMDDVMYYTDVKLLSDIPTGENTTRQELQSWINTLIWRGSVTGKTPEQVISEITTCGTSQKEYNLTSLTDYVVLTASLTKDGLVNSDVKAVEFRTGEIQMSDNTFEIEVIEIGSSQVTAKVVPSNLEDPYVLKIAKKSDWDSYASDQEFLDKYIEDNWFYCTLGAVKGEQEFNLTNSSMYEKLIPGTEYYLFAFGFAEDKATTGPTKLYVKTLPLGDASAATININVSNITSSSADVEVTCDPESVLFYWSYAPSGITEEEARAEVEEQVEKYIGWEVCVDFLDFMRNWKGFRGNNAQTITALTPNTEYVIYAVTIDEEAADFAQPFTFSDPFTTLSDGTASVSAVSQSYEEMMSNLHREQYFLYKSKKIVEKNVPNDQELELPVFRLGKRINK